MQRLLLQGRLARLQVVQALRAVARRQRIDEPRGYWTEALWQGERELDAAKTRTALNTAAKNLIRAKATAARRTST